MEQKPTNDKWLKYMEQYFMRTNGIRPGFLDDRFAVYQTSFSVVFKKWSNALKVHTSRLLVHFLKFLHMIHTLSWFNIPQTVLVSLMIENKSV